MSTPTPSGKIAWRAVIQLALGVAAGLIAGIGALAVAVASFTLSFDASRAVAKAAHVSDGIAWMMPVSIDGAIMVATIAAVVMHRTGQRGGKLWYPWTVMGVGVAISIACNGAHATGTTGTDGAIQLHLTRDARFAISAIPAVMLALSMHLFMTLIEAFFEGVGKPHRAAPAVSAPEAGTGVTVRAAAQRPQAPAGGLPGEARPALPAPSPETATASLTGEGSGTPGETPGEPAPAAPKTTRTAARPATRKTTARKTTGAGSKPAKTGVDARTLQGMSDADLVVFLHNEFPEGATPRVSGRKVAMRFRIGSTAAGEIARRYTAITDEPSPGGAGEVTGTDG